MLTLTNYIILETCSHRTVMDLTFIMKINKIQINEWIIKWLNLYSKARSHSRKEKPFHWVCTEKKTESAGDGSQTVFSSSNFTGQGLFKNQNAKLLSGERGIPSAGEVRATLDHQRSKNGASWQLPIISSWWAECCKLGASAIYGETQGRAIPNIEGWQARP